MVKLVQETFCNTESVRFVQNCDLVITYYIIHLPAATYMSRY